MLFIPSVKVILPDVANCVAIKGGGPMINIQGHMAELCEMANVIYETG